MSGPAHDPSSDGPDPVDYRLVLFVAGASALSTNAIERIRDVCDHELAGRVQLVPRQRTPALFHDPPIKIPQIAAI